MSPLRRKKTTEPASPPEAKGKPGPKFDPNRLMTLLLAPVVSEKATQLADKHNQVIFRVRPDATKVEIKAAVELMWKDKKVEVKDVQIVNVQGKTKRFGAYGGRRRHWKKAYICLKPGQEITFAQEV